MVVRALQYSPISVEQWDGMGMQPLASMLVEPFLRIIHSVGLFTLTLLPVEISVIGYGPIWCIN